MNMYAFAAIMMVLNIAAFGWPYVEFLYGYCSKRFKALYTAPLGQYNWWFR
jgi:hypothetical protein